MPNRYLVPIYVEIEADTPEAAEARARELSRKIEGHFDVTGVMVMDESAENMTEEAP